MIQDDDKDDLIDDPGGRVRRRARCVRSQRLLHSALSGGAPFTILVLIIVTTIITITIIVITIIVITIVVITIVVITIIVTVLVIFLLLTGRGNL